MALAGGYIAPVDNAAHPALMLGIAFEFGDTVSKPDIGLTAKLLSSNKPDKAVVGGGVTYFPWAKEQFGVDLDIGYVVSNGGLLAGYDFLRWKPQFSAGYVQTDDGTHCPAGYIFNGSGSCTINAPSDRRLKRNIKRLATLAHGIKLYSFNYLWSDTTYVGVMAQDLLAVARWADAVHLGSDGFY